MIGIVIPTMPERSKSLIEVQGQLERVSWAQGRWVVSEHVDSRKDVQRAVELALGAFPYETWIMYLEDDVWLSPLFWQIEGLLRSVPPSVGAASFFALPNLAPRGWHKEIPSRKLSMTQCVCLRRDLFEGFSEFAPGWYEQHPEHYHASDILFGAYLAEKRAAYWVWNPSLVQHRMGKSTLGPRARTRQSATYLLNFGDVPPLD